MNLQTSQSASQAGSDFDLLRGRLEVEVARPGVVAITSSTAEDGKEIAARGIAQSLAAAGYATLYIDASLSGRALARPSAGASIEDVSHQISPASSLVALSLTDPQLQKATSQRSLLAALQTLRAKFDYIVISAEHGVSNSFSTSVLAAADAVLVTVRTNRRQKPADAKLSAMLDRAGDRFLGVLAIEPSFIKEGAVVVAVPAVAADTRRSKTAQAG